MNLLETKLQKGMRGREAAEQPLVLLHNGLYELSDLANLTADKLLALSTDQMTFGVANRLVTYAKDDFEQFSGHVSKHTRGN
jgi:hypothetical protein